MTAQGGKSIYGVSVGILMLDARFPRIQGDMGNAATWPFPVLYKIVKGATPDLVVRQGAAGTLDTFISAARELVEMGLMASPQIAGFYLCFKRAGSGCICAGCQLCPDAGPPGQRPASR